MSNEKISAFTAATLPLSGAEDIAAALSGANIKIKAASLLLGSSPVVVNVTSGASAVNIDPTAGNLFLVTTGGTGGVELINVPAFTLDDNGNNLPNINRLIVVATQVLTGAYDTPEVQIAGSGTVGSGSPIQAIDAVGRIIGTYGDYDGNPAVPIDYPGGYVCLFWNGESWTYVSVFDNDATILSQNIVEGTVYTSGSTPDVHGLTWYFTAGGTVQVPAATSLVSGKNKARISAVNTGAASNLILRAAGGDKIAFAGVGASSANGTMTSATQYASAVLECVPGVEGNLWFARSFTGVWVPA